MAVDILVQGLVFPPQPSYLKASRTTRCNVAVWMLQKDQGKQCINLQGSEAKCSLLYIKASPAWPLQVSPA